MIHPISSIAIDFDVRNMADTVFCSYLNVTRDTLIRTFGGAAPRVAPYPQKRSPRPSTRMRRRGKLPFLTA